MVSDFSPNVSVIIPTYNREVLIIETIHSVLCQTYKDFEIIVVDDGSIDNTQKVIKDIGDSRVKYIFENHRGVPAATRNTGIRNAQGQYIAFVDSDDLWLPDKLERQLFVMEKFSDIALVYAQAVSWSEGVISREPLPKPSLAKSGFIFRDLFLRNFIPSLTVMVRKKIFDTVGYFDEDPDLIAAEDYDLWLRTARIARVYFMPEIVAKYRIHSGNISANIENYISQSLAIVNKFRKNGWVEKDLVKDRSSNIYLDATIASYKRGFTYLKLWLMLRCHAKEINLSSKL